ncbi:DUF2218 domain-containing protein [Sphingobium sp. DEHP117]|uniref:DUF2218 domain-containing protein n=1 Tax=Sphingobium sp. DEHP117 TaxID=2993436 RepID=UPI0027D958E3|nr:DUF2218 domain-containing protein [Sphingobium sp. DEHP117]
MADTSGRATATVATAHASRYLQQLCKHWSHKFKVECDAEQGMVELGAGVLRMRAKPDMLEVDLEVTDAEALPRVKQVVAEHLDRFAFREAPLPFVWS